MGPIENDVTPYVVMRGTCDVEVLARCRNWDDAFIVAERHPVSYIHNTENGRDYYRTERVIIAYDPKE